jgi:chromosome segregation ATPase
MASPSSLEGKADDEGSKENVVLYVETLEGENDYWLSITDAARVCRVQDVSIRRAIARGALPVRQQRAGQNKRTRFVRASDLPKIGFPIIDESAAITTEIGKADILSIPRQQQRIMQDHKDLLTKLAEMQKVLAEYQTSALAHFQQQRDGFYTVLRDMHGEHTRQLEAVETRLAQAQEKLQQSLTKAEQQRTQEQQAIYQSLEQVQTDAREQEERTQTLLLRQLGVLKTYQAEVQQALTHIATTQQESLQAYQQSVNQKLQQIEQNAQDRLTLAEQRLTSNLEASTKATGEQLTHLASQLSLLQQAYEDLSQRLTTRDQELHQETQEQQRQLDQLAQLLPLLPYAGQPLLTEQSVSAWAQELADLEARLLIAQQNELVRYQPLLALLVPERLEALERLLTEKTVVSAQGQKIFSEENSKAWS